MPHYSGPSAFKRFKRVHVEAPSEAEAVARLIRELPSYGFTPEEVAASVATLSLSQPPNPGVCFTPAMCSGLNACPRRIACND